MKKSNFSMQAIESMARKAAVEAEVKKAQQHTAQNKISKKKTRKTPKSGFEAQVNAFRNALTSTLPADEYRITFDNDSRNAGKATITVYKVADLARQQEEAKEYRTQLARGRDKNLLTKPFQAKFDSMYVLYQGSAETESLESVAIYGADATQRCTAITKRGALYGFPVRYATVEIGRRPFVDVHLKQTPRRPAAIDS